MKAVVKHIVLADDDTEDVEMFQLALQEACPDSELNVAADGEALMKLLTTIPVPDIIVLDLNMPRKSGKLCLREIRANSLYNLVPIVVLSTSRSADDIKFCLVMGANRFFTKPNKFKELISIIEEISRLAPLPAPGSESAPTIRQRSVGKQPTVGKYRSR